MHTDWQKRVQKQPHGDERPCPAPQSYLIDPHCPIDGTDRDEQPEHNVEAIGVPSECCDEQQNHPERGKKHFQ